MRFSFALLLFLLVSPAAALTNCFNDNDCISGSQYCSTDSKLCVSNNWVDIAPYRQRIKLTDKADFLVTVRDPVGRAGTYNIQLSGSGKYFAKFFGSQTEIRIALQPGEMKQIPLTLTPPSTTAYEVQLQAVDMTYKNQPGGIYSNVAVATVEVQAARSGFTALSAPGPSALAYLVLAVLAGGFLYLGGKRNGKL